MSADIGELDGGLSEAELEQIAGGSPDQGWREFTRSGETRRFLPAGPPPRFTTERELFIPDLRVKLAMSRKEQ
jgi:hypothetical protein